MKSLACLDSKYASNVLFYFEIEASIYKILNIFIFYVILYTEIQMMLNEQLPTFLGFRMVPESLPWHTATWNSRAHHPRQAWTRTSGMLVSQSVLET